MSDFSRGMDFACRGIGEFFRRPKLWSFVVLPMLAVLAVYAGLSVLVLGIWLPEALTAVGDFFADGWLSFLRRPAEIGVKVFFYAGAAIFTAMTAGNLFEVLGSGAFAGMVRYYETEVLKCRVEPLSPLDRLRNLGATIVFSGGTWLLCLMFFLIGIVLPVVSPLLMIVFVGCRYAISYTSEAVFNSGRRLGETVGLFHGHRGLLYGFGALAFLIFFVPVLPILLAPGLFIGGTLMYHHRRG